MERDGYRVISKMWGLSIYGGSSKKDIDAGLS